MEVRNLEVDVEVEDLKFPGLRPGHVDEVELLLIVLEKVKKFVGDVWDEIVREADLEWLFE